MDWDSGAIFAGAPSNLTSLTFGTIVAHFLAPIL